jgi:hypothetical protein
MKLVGSNYINILCMRNSGSRLGGVVVSVLATGPKGSSRMGSKVGRSHVVRFYFM